MAEPWAAGIFLLVVTLGLPGVALFLTWPRTPAVAGRATVDGHDGEHGEVPGAPVAQTWADDPWEDDTPGEKAPAASYEDARETALAEADGFDAERALVAVAVPASVFVVFTELAADLQQLTATVIGIYATVVAIASVAVLLVFRHQWIERVNAPGLGRRWLTRLPAVGLVLAAATAQVKLVLDRTDSLISPTSWYYWQQSVAIARTNSVPTLSREWGTYVDFFDYHLGFNTFSSAIAKATGSVPDLFAAQLMRIVVAFAAVIAMWLFARAWGAPRYAAAAAAIAVPTISIFANKLSSFRPESAGYLFALAAAGLLHRWFLKPRWYVALAALITFIGVTQVHTPAAVVAATLCAGTAIAHARWSWRWVIQLVAVGLTLVVVWFAADLITGHRGPFSDQFAKPPALAKNGKDPTYEFAQLATLPNPLDRPELGMHPPAGRPQLKKSLTEGFLVGGRTSYWILIGAVLATLIAAIALRRWMIVRYMVAGIVFMVLLGAVLVVTQLGWDTYVPRRTGFSRFINFWWFVPLAAVALSGALVRRRWFRIVVSALLVVVASGLWFASRDATADLAEQQPTARTLEELRALKLPPGALILSNGFTQDFVQYNTPGDGLTDGRAPYLEQHLLARANKILRLTSAYFVDPVANPFPFDEYHVDYVLVSTLENSLGTPAVYAANVPLLDMLPNLTRLSSGEGWVLYQVKH